MKKKIKFIVGILLFTIILFVGMTTVNAAVEVTRNIYSNDGSMKFEFTGLTLDTTKEYEFALTNTTAETPAKWFDITEYTANTAIIDIRMNTKELRDAFNKSDVGYITIREKDATTATLEPYKVDLKMPYMQVTSFTTLNNGKDFGLVGKNDKIYVPLRNKGNSEAYYQYEKITDENVINKYKEIKSKNGDFTDLENVIKITVPSSGWKKWDYFSGYNGYGNGFGYPQQEITVPDMGLYYMWVYFSGENLKSLYGVILVDNLQPEIALDSISLPKTKEVELGKTLTLKPTFIPETTTNKIVTWTSSDESVATVSNAGVVTPKKVGSTIITVTSQDGNKKATCTVTVTNTSNDTSDSNNNGESSSNSSSSESSSKKNSSTNSNTNNNSSKTNQPKTLPKTGVGISLIVVTFIVAGVSTIMYKKYKLYKGI